MRCKSDSSMANNKLICAHVLVSMSSSRPVEGEMVQRFVRFTVPPVVSTTVQLLHETSYGSLVLLML